MKYRHIGYIVLLAALGLAGCAGTMPQPTDADAQRAEEVSVGGAVESSESAPPGLPSVGGETAGVGEPADVQVQPLPPISENRAVIALLDRAHQDNAAGRADVAGSSLERALRIEPRNPWLWHEFAQLRLSQGQYAQAVSFAQKSNSFARRDRRLQAKNWRLIADARIAQGDQGAARKALARAEAIEKQEP